MSNLDSENGDSVEHFRYERAIFWGIFGVRIFFCIVQPDQEYVFKNDKILLFQRFLAHVEVTLRGPPIKMANFYTVSMLFRYLHSFYKANFKFKGTGTGD